MKYLILAFLGASVVGCSPSDMVPYPNPPWDQPKDNDEGDLA